MLLDLNTLIDARPPIRVDGAIYHLKSSEELSLAESQQFTKWGKALEELGKAEDMAGLEALVVTVAQAILVDMPGEVFAKLSTRQMMDVIEVFTGLLLGRRLRLAGALAGQVTGQSTGGKSSPGSSAPLAATPAGGSTPPQPLS
jgi:hypothetical protein